LAVAAAAAAARRRRTAPPDYGDDEGRARPGTTITGQPGPGTWRRSSGGMAGPRLRPRHLPRSGTCNTGC
jgi:hypothetical protein